MDVLRRFVTPPHACPYLPDRQAVLDYALVRRLTGAEYEALMDAGHRKFGPLCFRPTCPECTACRPLRVPVAGFSPSRSQRRAWRTNADLEVKRASPTVDAARLDLYQRYHEAQSARKGWEPKGRDTAEYELSFLHNPVPGLEITLWAGERLVAVVLTDITPNVVSGVYHYHEPTLSHRGLGTYCMLQTIAQAQRLKRRWAYFGYYVAGCDSLAYKARFRPCELMSEDGEWLPFES